MSKKSKKSVPQVRFPEFHDDWTEKKLSEISNKISDGIHSTPRYDANGEYYFINGNNLIASKIEFDENTKRIDLSEYLKHKSDLNSQTILVSINGTIGNLSFYENEKIVLGKSACYVNLKSKENKIFVFYLLQTSSIKNHFNKELTGSTIKNLSLGTIKNTKALFPSDKEQEKIANFLGAIDIRLTQLRRKHELLQTYKRGVMQKIFSQQIRFKGDRGKSFPDWEEKYLDELGEFKNGFNADKSAFGDGVEFINLMDIFGKSEIKKTSLDRVQISQQQLDQYKVQKGDTLFVRSSVKREGVGQSCLVNDDFENTVYSGFIIRFREKSSELIHSYKKYCFSSLGFRQDLLSLATSSANTNINQESLSSINLTYPCQEEQGKIVDFLTAIDKKIEAVSQQINLTEQFKKGLLQKMFV